MKSRDSKSGVVLVGVLAIIVVLIAVLMDFTYRAKVQLDMAENRINSIKARQAAESGLDAVKGFMSGVGDLSSPEYEDLFTAGETVTFGEAVIRIRLEPESSKINLNRLIGRDGRPRRDARLMFRLSEMLGAEYDDPPLTYDKVFSILEWIAPEGAVSEMQQTVPGELTGSEHYRQKKPPYECKHAPLNTISELLLVKGITEEILYGRPAAGDEPAVPGLARFFTLFGNSSGIEPVLRGEGMEMEDLLELEPDPDERYFTVHVHSTLGNAVEKIEAVLIRDGLDVREVLRENN